MMRWIIGSSLRFRLLVVGIAAAVIAVGILQLRDAPVDVLPGVHAAVRGGPDRGARPLRRGGRAARHRAARGRPAERDEGRDRAALGVRAGRVLDRAALRAGHDPLRGAAARPGAAHAGAREPERLAAAADAAAAVLGEPRDDDRPLAATGCRRSRPRCSPAGRSGRACSASTASPTSRSSARATASSRCSSTPSGCATTASRCPGHPHRRQRAARVAAELPGGLHAGHRRLHRHRQPAPADPPHPAHRHARAAGERARRGHAAARRCAWATSAAWSRTTSP